MELKKPLGAQIFEQLADWIFIFFADHTKAFMNKKVSLQQYTVDRRHQVTIARDKEKKAEVHSGGY